MNEHVLQVATLLINMIIIPHLELSNVMQFIESNELLYYIGKVNASATTAAGVLPATHTRT